MAREAGLDLVEVAPTARPPVCRIMDYGKWRYQQQKKEDKSRASSRGGQLKELKLRTVKIGDHDLEIKINRARDFLSEGHKVQFTLQFRGREMAHMELGREIFRKVKEQLWQVSKVEPGRDNKMEGRRMTLVLQPDQKPEGAVMPKQITAPAPPPRPIIDTRPGQSGNRGPAPHPSRFAPVGAAHRAAAAAAAAAAAGGAPGAPRPAAAPAAPAAAPAPAPAAPQPVPAGAAKP